jgi:hypothetical protein
MAAALRCDPESVLLSQAVHAKDRGVYAISGEKTMRSYAFLRGQILVCSEMRVEERIRTTLLRGVPQARQIQEPKYTEEMEVGRLLNAD